MRAFLVWVMVLCLSSAYVGTSEAQEQRSTQREATMKRPTQLTALTCVKGRVFRAQVQSTRKWPALPLGGATVSLVEKGSHATIASAFSDDNGYFCFDNVPLGEMQIMAVHAGYEVNTLYKTIVVRTSGQPHCATGLCNCYDVGDLIAGGGPW